MQSLIRRYKSNISDPDLGQLTGFAYRLDIECEYDTKIMISKKTASKCLYTIGELTPGVAPLTDEIFEFDEARSLCLNDLVTDRGILANTFQLNACSRASMPALYFISKLYRNYIDINNMYIRSFHISDNLMSEVESMRHFLYNSTATQDIVVDWDWFGVSSRDDPPDSKNILNVLDGGACTFDNVNIILGIIAKTFKVNYLSICCDYAQYSNYLLLFCKILTTDCTVCVSVPHFSKWDTKFIQVLLLYSLFFREVLVYKLDLGDDDICDVFLVCRNKKKTSNDQLYKKLLYINNNNMAGYNTFPEEVFKLPEYGRWLTTIRRILAAEQSNRPGKVVALDEILQMITDTLKPKSTNMLDFD